MHQPTRRRQAAAGLTASTAPLACCPAAPLAAPPPHLCTLAHPTPPRHPRLLQDARVNWICNPVHKHRELRGLTSAGKKYRGLQGKGHLHNKARPSRRAVWRKNNSISLRRYR